MKCPSCKYEKRTFSEFIEEPVYYKSGKRKGEIKEIVKEEVVFFENDPDFIELYMKKDVDELVYDDPQYNWFREIKTATLIACPCCGTVFVKELNDC